MRAFDLRVVRRLVRPVGFEVVYPDLPARAFAAVVEEVEFKGDSAPRWSWSAIEGRGRYLLYANAVLANARNSDIRAIFI